MNSVHVFVIDLKKKNLAGEIATAMRIYEERFGRKPKKVFVNPNLRVEEQEIDGVLIERHERVRPINHVWCGDTMPKPRVVKDEEDLDEAW